MPTRDIPIGHLGRIVAGPETGRVIEIIEDYWGTGSYFIFTYADFDRSDTDDTWVEDYAALQSVFEDASWQITWSPHSRAA